MRAKSKMTRRAYGISVLRKDMALRPQTSLSELVQTQESGRDFAENGYCVAPKQAVGSGKETRRRSDAC